MMMVPLFLARIEGRKAFVILIGAKVFVWNCFAISSALDDCQQVELSVTSKITLSPR